MSTRKSDAADVVKRAKAVSWPVETLPGGALRVTCPDNHRVQVHLTPSDRNGNAAALEDLIKHGLLLAEAEAAKLEAAVRRERIEADRERNDKKLAQHAAAVARAAGPYGAVAPSLDEMLAKHPAPITWTRVLITPEMADAMLARNTHNRKIFPNRIAEWSRILREDRWLYTHQGIAFDVNGILADGQHRLTAIRDTEVAAELMVSAGIPDKVRAVVDTGMARTGGHTLQMVQAVNASAMASVLRMLHIYTQWGEAAYEHKGDHYANDLLLQAWSELQANPEDLALLTHLNLAAGRLHYEIDTAVSGVAAAFYAIAKAVGADDREEVLDFVERFITGGTRDEHTPIMLVRRALERNARHARGIARRAGSKYTGLPLMGIVIQAWNLHIDGRDIKAFRPVDRMPVVRLPHD